MTDWLAMRDALVNGAWPQGFPGKKMPETVTLNADITYNGVLDPNAQVNGDLLRVRLPRTTSASAQVEVVHPLGSWNGRCFVMHGGHYITYFEGGSVFTPCNMQSLTKALTAAGWMILGCAQPFMGANDRVYHYEGGVDMAAYEPVDVYPWVGHYQLHQYEAIFGESSLPQFLEPAIVGMNYVQATYGVRDFAFSGISGGGWTTEMMAAVDPRITRSYPALGSIPFQLWSIWNGGIIADFESNSYCRWFQDTGASMENIYTLGCFDPGRRQIKIVEHGDTAWTAAGHDSDIAAWKALVQSRVPTGQYDVYVGSIVSAHTYSMGAIRMILDDLERPLT
jgi:hypothetical protein